MFDFSVKSRRLSRVECIDALKELGRPLVEAVRRADATRATATDGADGGGGPAHGRLARVVAGVVVGHVDLRLDLDDGRGQVDRAAGVAGVHDLPFDLAWRMPGKPRCRSLLNDP